MNTTVETSPKFDICLTGIYVYVPVWDGAGGQRSIFFPRIRATLYGSPTCHWTSKPYMSQARKTAIQALKDAKKNGQCLNGM